MYRYYKIMCRYVRKIIFLSQFYASTWTFLIFFPLLFSWLVGWHCNLIKSYDYLSDRIMFRREANSAYYFVRLGAFHLLENFLNAYNYYINSLNLLFLPIDYSSLTKISHVFIKSTFEGELTNFHQLFFFARLSVRLRLARLSVRL